MRRETQRTVLISAFWALMCVMVLRVCARHGAFGALGEPSPVIEQVDPDVYCSGVCPKGMWGSYHGGYTEPGHCVCR